MNSTEARGLLLFGASGQIGSALKRAWASSSCGPVHELRWREAARPDWEAVILPLLDRHGAYDLVIANGLTDPRLPREVLAAANLEFPKMIVRIAARFPDTRVLTLGTIQENFPDLCAGNPYLLSKLELSRWLIEESCRLPSRLMHVRLHTVYGGEPKPYMFLGQIISALREHRPFEMSSGDQLREYHHVDDIARSLTALLSRDWREVAPVVEITSGHPLRLADLARSVFRALGQEGLLKVGSLSRMPTENTQKTFPRSPDWLLPMSRDPLQGVIDFVRASVESPGRSSPRQ